MNMTRLLIIRHGNTFTPDETPRRIGARTDIPLVESGREQARKIGAFLLSGNRIPGAMFSSQLQRAVETADIIGKALQTDRPAQINPAFNEIDHGPDENQADADIAMRIGQKALDAWNRDGILPPGWIADPEAIRKGWLVFADQCLKDRGGEVTAAVSSGGIIRFAPVISGGDIPARTPKVSTGSISSFIHDGKKWRCEFWNFRPD